MTAGRSPRSGGLAGEPARARASRRGDRRRSDRGPQDRVAARGRRCGRGRRARGRRRGPGAGGGRTGRARTSGPFAAADLEGAWLAFTATGDPAVDARGVRGGRGGAGLGQQRRRPGQLFLYADVAWSGGPTWSSRSAPVGVVPRSRRTFGAGSRRRSDLSTRRCSRCSPRPGNPCAPPAVPAKTPTGNERSTPASWRWCEVGALPTRRSC